MREIAGGILITAAVLSAVYGGLTVLVDDRPHLERTAIELGWCLLFLGVLGALTVFWPGWTGWLLSATGR